VDDVVYVAGYDRKLHALNAYTGYHYWAFDGATAGYDTNPLVVDGRVFVGNRDGHMYAIGAHGSAYQGQLLWKYKTGGPIHLSAAYQNGVVYFAANDNHAYALRATNGSLVWKSAKLPGDGYHSYWPVIYKDKVIFTASLSYRHGLEPGTKSVEDTNNALFTTYPGMEYQDIFRNEAPVGQLIGPYVADQEWANGYRIIDASRITEYTENNPNPDPFAHKPWRRLYIMLNQSNGQEYTFDSDGDGYPEYVPFVSWGTKSGNRYPPIVGPEDTLYASNLYQYIPDAQGRVMGWKMGTPYLSVLWGQGAVVEPQAISIGGSLVYRNLCCDRVGDFFGLSTEDRSTPLWGYNLSDLAPGYDEMWTILPGWPRLQGWYKGNTNSINGIYHNHGDQNPIIPYAGKLFVHRSNAIIAFGTGPSIGKLPLLQIADTDDDAKLLTRNELAGLLEESVEKIVDAGHLRPGYYNAGQFTLYKELADYFDNPGDTLYTLAKAHPYLSPELQQRTETYLQQEFEAYFNSEMYSTIGWAGAARESMPLPPEIEANLSQLTPLARSQRFLWEYPQHNFYAMWKYAQIFPGQANLAYSLAKEKIHVPVPPLPVPDYFDQKPYELNAYIAGYIGFLELQELAGQSGTDSQLRSSVTNELNRLLQLRANTFTKDTYWVDSNYHKRALNIARNFMMLVPELGDYLHDNELSRMSEAINEYDYVAPYWFVSRYESMMNEGVMSPLYNYSAMFQAKAYVLQEPYEELVKYLDVPAFERGDLLYIQNIIAALEAEGGN
jgi:hypothetical protein